MRTIVVAVVILSACSLQEVSGAQLHSGADLNQQPQFNVHPTREMRESDAEYEKYDEEEEATERNRESAIVSEATTREATRRKAEKDGDMKEQLLEAKLAQKESLAKIKEKEAFENLDKDEKEEREEEQKEDKREAQIKVESEEKKENIKEDTEFNRGIGNDDKKEFLGKVKSKTEAKVVKANVVKSEEQFFHVDENKHDEPDQKQSFHDMTRGDDKELTDMFFEDGKDDKAAEDNTLEPYMPGQV